MDMMSCLDKSGMNWAGIETCVVTYNIRMIHFHHYIPDTKELLGCKPGHWKWTCTDQMMSHPLHACSFLVSCSLNKSIIHRDCGIMHWCMDFCVSQRPSVIQNQFIKSFTMLRESNSLFISGKWVCNLQG